MKKDRISIIIPVLNEEKTISKILSSIEGSIESEHFELIVVDGGSQDQTKKKCLAQIKKLQLRSKFIWVDCKKGRAHQMNAGALIAKYNVLFFVHSDTLLPKGFDQHIFKMLKKVPAGCFRLKFDSNKWFLRFFAFFTRFNYLICRGGDQTLFLQKQVFEELSGFDSSYKVYEDNEFISRLYKKYSFGIIAKEVITSARKYRKIGFLKLQYHYAMIHALFFVGYPPTALKAYYNRRIKSQL